MSGIVPAGRTRKPLSCEGGIGDLTLGGYLREVTTRFAEREAAVLRDGVAERPSKGILRAP